MSSHRRARWVLLGLLLCYGCASPASYTQPIARFQEASSIVIVGARLYINDLNKVEREAYVSARRAKREPIILKDLEGTRLISAEGLQARFDALDTLTKYGNLLATLAGSDAPDRIVAEANDLQEALKGLAATTQKLSGSAGNEQFVKAVGVATTVFGEVARFAIEKKIQAALDSAITKGEAPIAQLMTVISEDLTAAFERRRSSLSKRRVELIDVYNKEVAKGSSADDTALDLFAERIVMHEDRWEALPEAHPTEGLDAMRHAHQALVDYAKSDKKPQDLVGLVAAMETFVSRAKRLAAAVLALKGGGGE